MLGQTHFETKSQPLWNQVSEGPLGFGDIFDGKATCCRDDELGDDPIVLVHLLDIRAFKIPSFPTGMILHV